MMVSLHVSNGVQTRRRLSSGLQNPYLDRLGAEPKELARFGEREPPSQSVFRGAMSSIWGRGNPLPRLHRPSSAEYYRGKLCGCTVHAMRAAVGIVFAVLSCAHGGAVEGPVRAEQVKGARMDESSGRRRAKALLGTTEAGARVTPAEASPPARDLGAEEGFAFSWDRGKALSSVYVFDSYAEATRAESVLAQNTSGRSTVNGELLLWVTGDEAIAASLLQSFAGEE